MYIFTNKNNFQEKREIDKYFWLSLQPTCILFVVSMFYKVYMDNIQVSIS